MKVHLFIPCFIDQFFPGTAWNMIKILKKAGCEISYNKSQTCCGQPAYNAGFCDESRNIARRFIKGLGNTRYVVGPSGSCTGFIRNYYEGLFADSKIPENHHSIQFFEFTEFITQVLHIENIGATLKGIATYHDACGALRECSIKAGPRKLLSNVKGLELRETQDCEVCCGFGGTFSVKFDSISTGMVEVKVHSALEKGVDYIISTDSSCLLHLDGYIRSRNVPIKTMHIVDVLASGW